MKKYLFIVLLGSVLLGWTSCQNRKMKAVQEETEFYRTMDVEKRLKKYVPVTLTTDLSQLSENEKEVLKLLIEAADIMNDIFWQEAYGNKDDLLSKLADENAKRFAEINYGPWDRLDGNQPFVEGFGEKPRGANFYPPDMTEDEFNAFNDACKKSNYTLIRRDENGNLKCVWYHEAFKEQIEKVTGLLVKAAEATNDDELKNYLLKRAEALRTDNYRESDFAWLSMQNNHLDLVIGPIETYEDQLFGYKAAHEAYVLIKDMDWSQKLKRYVAFLPELQKLLPVDEPYKSETPGTSGSQLNAYDVVYYAGDCNAGSKTIAINLPNDEVVRDSMGSRKLQLKNAMKAKFDNILIPIANILVAEDQRSHVTFDAFFANTMFHEVAHGLGLGYTVKDKSLTVREALKDAYTTIEEGKADILGLYIVTTLYEKGELGAVDLMDYYVTFMTSIFRSVRFGAVSAHGKANMLRFNYFQEMKAFERDSVTGTYRVNMENMRKAMEQLTTRILTIQGDGDYQGAMDWIKKDAVIKEPLASDLLRLEKAGIPVDIVFVQGVEALGL